MIHASFKRFVWLLALLLAAPLAARAAAPAPEALVKKVTEEVLTILREHKHADGVSRGEAIKLIEDKVAPHFDFRRMTALAVGRGWREADDGQREALIEAFHTLLVRTYANALSNYENQTVSFIGAQGAEGAQEITVRSQINQPGATPIALDYRLERTDQGWKVFDVAVDHVSLVTSYRGSFAAELRKGGVDGLLQALQNKLHSLDAAPAAAREGSTPPAGASQAGRG